MMNPQNSKNLTPHQDINALLADCVHGVTNSLGENVVGLYLFGSLTYGDFVPERSDIDLQAVLRRTLTEEEIPWIEELHKGLEQRYPGWANRIECSYLPADLLPEILPPKTPRPWWGFGKLYAEALYGNEWIINQYLLHTYGAALHGPDFKTLISPVDMKEVQKASARDLFQEWEPKRDDPEWHSNGHAQSYLVLNLCRILYTVLCSEVGSKKAAATWIKTTFPQWEDLVAEAERWKYGMEMKRRSEATAFMEFAIEKVNDAGCPEVTRRTPFGVPERRF